MRGGEGGEVAAEDVVGEAAQGVGVAAGGEDLEVAEAEEAGGGEGQARTEAQTKTHKGG